MKRSIIDTLETESLPTLTSIGSCRAGRTFNSYSEWADDIFQEFDRWMDALSADIDADYVVQRPRPWCRQTNFEYERGKEEVDTTNTAVIYCDIPTGILTDVI